MKIEIDLDDIFRDEDGNPEESMEESVRRQVMDRLTGDLRKRLFDRLDGELGKAMSAMVKTIVGEKGPAIIEDILNVKYTPISTYGQRGEETTFRDELVKTIGGQMKYEPKNYSSDENVFTRAVKAIVDTKTTAIKNEIITQVDANFKRDAINFAVVELSKRIGLQK